MIVVVPLISLVVNVVIQLSALRLQGGRDVWGSVLLGFAAGSIVAIGGSLLALTGMPSGEVMAVLLMNFVSFTALGYGYFTFVNLNFTSLRVRLLRELASHECSVTREKLLGAYNAEEALTLRLTRLLEKQQLTARGDRYYVDRMTSFLCIAYVLDLLKWLLLGRLRG